MSSDSGIGMEYNTERDLMQIPEYGRNIQKMIGFAKTIADRDERNRAARSIIQVMGQVNPQLKNNEDLTHKLWDHLFIISDFDLDVDSPFTRPIREDFETGPDRIPYPEREITYRHYGRVVEQMIKEVSEIENDEERSSMGVAIANIMKRAYLNWNRDSVEDRVIRKDLRELSGGKIEIPRETELTHSKDLIEPAQKQNTQNRQRNKGRGKRKKNNRRNQRN